MPTSEAFVDDRPDLRADPPVSRQQMLFPSIDPIQRTLEDKPASLRFLFEEYPMARLRVRSGSYSCVTPQIEDSWFCGVTLAGRSRQFTNSRKFT